jgi:hypothetical protein
MTGCAGLLGVLDALRNKPLNYGLRFVFCGSEERGLLGSKAYVRDHEAELPKIALNINLDMIGTIMGRFIACVSAEENLVSFIKYFAAARGLAVDAHTGVYSSDSTPFADHGVPSLSFARVTPGGQSTIHCRYDTMILLSDEQLRADGDFCADFTAFMADAVVCPVSRTIPDKIRDDLAKMTKKEVYLDIKEVHDADADAQLVAEGIAQQLERRVALKRAMKRAMKVAMDMGVDGIKIHAGGRINGAEIARIEWAKEGKVPLHTLRAHIDYGFAEANTTAGKIGIKCWICKREDFQPVRQGGRREGGKRHAAHA